jgi:glycosyltransferase involved in cell wall biosynthesis
MADQLELLLKDEVLRRRLVSEGLATVKKFSWEAATLALEGVLTGL